MLLVVLELPSQAQRIFGVFFVGFLENTPAVGFIIIPPAHIEISIRVCKLAEANCFAKLPLAFVSGSVTPHNPP